MEQYNDTKVVVLPEAKESAYNMGFNCFEESHDVDDYWFTHYTESAEWANSKLPTLRCMAGYEDSMDRGTYHGYQEVAIVAFPDDRPMDADLVNSHYVLDELIDQFRAGAHDKLHGNDQYETFE